MCFSLALFDFIWLIGQPLRANEEAAYRSAFFTPGLF